MRRLIVFLFVVIAALAAEKVRYDGYKAYRVVPGTVENANKLKIIEKLHELNFWTEIRSIHKGVDIMVHPDHQSVFEAILKLYDMKYEVLVEDVQRGIEISRREETSQPVSKDEKFDVHKYHTHEEINAYLDQLANDHPDILIVESIGKSYEGREMKAIKISTGGNKNKPGILVDGGIHAREWASSAVALFTISQLVEDSNRHLIEKVDWYILPLLNPDGYTYSRDVDQFWRKTRSPGIYCDGTDPNRNFDFHWMETGGDDYECSEAYAGKSPLSEIECDNFAKFTLKHKDNLKLYVTFHSYGEYILYPWGYAEEYPENTEELRTLGKKIKDAISSVYGTTYTVGNSAAALYPAAGASDDWTKGVAGVPLAYTIELPGGGITGFDYPQNKLKNLFTETWEGIKAFHNHIEDNYSLN